MRVHSAHLSEVRYYQSLLLSGFSLFKNQWKLVDAFGGCAEELRQVFCHCVILRSLSQENSCVIDDIEVFIGLHHHQSLVP